MLGFNTNFISWSERDCGSALIPWNKSQCQVIMDDGSENKGPVIHSIVDRPG